MNYEAPELEVLEVMVECGFAGSTGDEETPGGGSTGMGTGQSPW